MAAEVSKASSRKLQLPHLEQNFEVKTVELMENVYIPCKEYPDFNFIGRLLGPRGKTIQALERETGCQLEVRGRRKANLRMNSEESHVLITAIDAPGKAEAKMLKAVDRIQQLLVPVDFKTDELKKSQLSELSSIKRFDPKPTKSEEIQSENDFSSVDDVAAENSSCYFPTVPFFSGQAPMMDPIAPQMPVFYWIPQYFPSGNMPFYIYNPAPPVVPMNYGMPASQPMTCWFA
jgi:hypothetical protein